jgi:hypothetical protein
MNVILDAGHLNGNDFVLPRDAADLGPDTLFDLMADQVRAAFGAEYDVIEQIRICVRHIDSVVAT